MMTFKFNRLAGVAAALAMTVGAAQAADEGRIQVKLFGTGVLPDGEITSVTTDNLGLPVGTQSEASDSYVPTVAIEYFFSPNISLETICCVTPHDVSGVGPLAGAALVDNAVILPATFTLKYHLTGMDGFKPYIGAGPSHFFIFGEDVGADAAALGVTNVDLSDEFGFALQAGFDLPINDTPWLVSLDAKRYFVNTTATFTGASGVLLESEHDLDPWVVSAGIGFRF